MVDVTTAEKLAELQRERKLRERVFPRFVAEGRMASEVAARRIEILDAIIADYASIEQFNLEG